MYFNKLTATMILLSPVLASANSVTVKDYRGSAVTFPQGERSFADKVLFSNIGNPGPIELKVPEAALGLPDWSVPDTQRRNFPDQAYSLGCRGRLAVQFEDNALIDGEGDDLFIFEVGANIEGSRVFVSNDGATWESVGQIGGAFASIDLAKSSLSSNTFRYVLVEDLGSNCDGITPGADIDAIGAIGSADRITLDGEILFDFAKSDLRQEAKAFLGGLVAQLANANATKIEVVGHTDSVGSRSANQTLGDDRARNVAEFLAKLSPEIGAILASSSRGELEPVSSNNTEAGRQKNRRVEVTIFKN